MLGHIVNLKWHTDFGAHYILDGGVVVMMSPIIVAFDHAAYALTRALDHAGLGNFEQSVRAFERSVEKMARILGMQAENNQRKAIGASMAYTYGDFANA